jgi:hypothetical protein
MEIMEVKHSEFLTSLSSPSVALNVFVELSAIWLHIRKVPGANLGTHPN